MADQINHSLVPSLLSPGERTTLLWICGALFPRLEAAGGDDPALFAADAVSLGVPAALEEALAAVPPDARVLIFGSLYLAGEVLAANGQVPD